MHLELLDPRERRAEALWRSLEAQSAPTYFLSWGWIENLLACLPPGVIPELATIVEAGVPIAACLLGQRRELRHQLVGSRELVMNATGVPRYDQVCIEHNGLLRAAGAKVSPADLTELLLPADWDELLMPAADRDELWSSPSPYYHVIVDREVGAPFVDLARVRAADYLGVLGADARAQIRRARRGLGELRIEVARDLPHALAIYDELVALHVRSWRARGQPGAFADPWFTAFHRRLIEMRFAHGEIQLIRVAAATTVGCLYHFVSHGRVLFYQSGLAAFDDPRIKPGYVCHAAAIEHAAASGHAIYDFLAGDRRYKHSLSTDRSDVVWLRVQRPRVRFAVEERLRGMRRALRAGARHLTRNAHGSRPAQDLHWLTSARHVLEVRL